MEVTTQIPTDRIAVLSKKNLPYAEWLRPAEVVVFAQDDPGARGRCTVPGSGFAPQRLFGEWKQNRQVDAAVVAAHAAQPFHRIVALSECDQIRAAQLRAALGVPGLGEQAARGFRDKALMKRLAAQAGLGVPDFATADDLWDVADFAGRHAHEKIVVKPIDGGGSRGVRVLGSPAELDRWLAARPVHNDEPARQVVEEYVDAPMLVVDGVMAGGRRLVAAVSRYVTTCYEQLTTLAPQGALQLSPDDPARQRALEFVDRLLRALPGPAEPTSFHCELFDDSKRGPLLCEIAARTGGCLFRETTRWATGVDLEQWSCLGQAGTAPDAMPAAEPAGHAGYVVVPAPGRPLVAVPAECPVPGVRGYHVHATAGEFVPRATKSSQNVVEVWFADPDPRTVAKIHETVLDWLDAHLRWA